MIRQTYPGRTGSGGRKYSVLFRVVPNEQVAGRTGRRYSPQARILEVIVRGTLSSYPLPAVAGARALCRFQKEARGPFPYSGFCDFRCTYTILAAGQDHVGGYLRPEALELCISYHSVQVSLDYPSVSGPQPWIIVSLSNLPLSTFSCLGSHIRGLCPHARHFRTLRWSGGRRGASRSLLWYLLGSLAGKHCF